MKKAYPEYDSMTGIHPKEKLLSHVCSARQMLSKIVWHNPVTPLATGRRKLGTCLYVDQAGSVAPTGEVLCSLTFFAWLNPFQIGKTCHNDLRKIPSWENFVEKVHLLKSFSAFYIHRFTSKCPSSLYGYG